MAQALPGRTVCSGVAGGMARAASTSNMAERSTPASGSALARADRLSVLMCSLLAIHGQALLADPSSASRSFRQEL